MNSMLSEADVRTAGSVIGIVLISVFVWCPGSFAQGRVTTLKPPAASAPAVQKAPTEVSIVDRTVEPDQIIAGVIREVAPDQTFIVVEDTRIITTPDFIEESLVETGDKVKISVVKTPKGLQAIGCTYSFEEGPEDLSSGSGNSEPPVTVPFLKDEDMQLPSDEKISR